MAHELEDHHHHIHDRMLDVDDDDDDDDEFSFPTATISQFMDSPPLWQRPPEDAVNPELVLGTTAPATNLYDDANWGGEKCRLCLLQQLIMMSNVSSTTNYSYSYSGDHKEEEKMDVLWQDLNADDCHDVPTTKLGHDGVDVVVVSASSPRTSAVDQVSCLKLSSVKAGRRRMRRIRFCRKKEKRSKPLLQILVFINLFKKFYAFHTNSVRRRSVKKKRACN